MIYDFLFSFSAVICYAYLFDVPRRPTIIAAFSGSLAWVTAQVWLADSFFGTFLAAFLIAAVAYLLAPRLQVPVTSMTIPGIIVLVPGATAYSALRAMIDGDYSSSLLGIISVAAVTFSIAGGLSIAELILLRFNRLLQKWQQNRKKSK
ncbi:MAG: threonine/serine exporter family protein [Negativicutes bacterium]|nr:threonine/serine exporter family protein [Negativicutes bacterium]